eukprot:1326958-Prymnesium_polylepis.1
MIRLRPWHPGPPQPPMPAPHLWPLAKAIVSCDRFQPLWRQLRFTFLASIPLVPSLLKARARS